MPSVDVIIKSSRRPWALDRLLRSLDKFLVSRNPVKIYCVDDRTDQRYLTELTRRYPNVDFSTRATWKENDRALGTLPYVEAWQRAVAQSQAEYVLVLEDDQWLCEPLNLDDCTHFMSSSGAWSLVLTEDASRLKSAKLFPSPKPNFGFYLPTILERSIEKPFSLTRFFLDFITSDRLIIQKAHGLLSTLIPQATGKQWQSIAQINPMCGAIFLKSHWSHLWGGRIPRINENIMIGRALRLLRHDLKPKQKLAIGSKKLFETTYLSSVSLTLGTDVDWDKFNRAWSNAWLEGGLRSPRRAGDWDFAVLHGIIQKEHGQVGAEAYEKWCSDFAILHSS